MTKTTSIVLVCILSVLILFFGIFSLLPDGLEYGDYNVYHAAVNLIQKGSDLGESVEGTYKIEAEEFAEGITADSSNLTKVLQQRLGNIFGYYNVPVSIENGTLKLTVPQTSDETKTSAQSILSAVTSKGVLEILSSSTYSEDVVVMSILDEQSNFGKVTTENYVNGANTYYLVTAALSEQGQEIAEDNFTQSTSSYAAYGAVDGSVLYGIIYSNTSFQFYASSTADAKALAAYINYGSLDASLTEIDVLPVEGSGLGLIISSIILGVLVLGICVFLAVRYGMLGLAGIFSLLLSVVLFVMFAGLVFFSVMNIYALIAIVISLGLFTYLTCDSFEKVRKGVAEGKAFGAACTLGFTKSVKLNLIINGAFLLLGIILWVIPTAVTVSMGNVFVYAAVLSFITTPGLNRLFAKMLYPLGEENPKFYGIYK